MRSRSSVGTTICQMTIHKAPQRKTIQDAQEIAILMNIRKPLKYMGCLDIRYAPLVTGLSIEEAAMLKMVVTDIKMETAKIGRPTYNHAEPILSGRKME